MTTLAERLRPKTFAEYVGQKEQLAHIKRYVEYKKPTSLLFWGPPGCGKTTLARLYCKQFNHPVETIHATSAGTQEFKAIIERTKESPLIFRPTILWIDEVHRLTRPQQDILLASCEDASIILVAATTENPSFQLAPALLSRLQVVTLKPLEAEDLAELIVRVETTCAPLTFTDEAKSTLISWAQGDARALCNMIEALLPFTTGEPIDPPFLEKYCQKKRTAIDSTGEGRYQLISALHKSVRSSDCQAALYWLARQLTAGEDARYIARRLVRMAIEDVGLADPQALSIALDGLKTYETLGSPEGELAVAQVVIYLALAPKSNAAYLAYKSAVERAEKTAACPPPTHSINAPTKWMKNQGFGDGYIYDHDLESGCSGQNYFPEAVAREQFYVPVERGYERELSKRIAYFSKLRNNK